MKDAWKDGIILAILLVFFVIGVFGILGLRRNSLPAPALEVSLDDITYTNKDTVTIMGKTDKNAKLTVNGQEVKVGNDGGFSFDEPVQPGENKITFEASNGGKQKTDIEKTVVRQESSQSVKSAETGQQPATGQQGTTSAGASGLNNSGPADSVFGAIGVVALLFALNYYRKSLKHNSRA